MERGVVDETKGPCFGRFLGISAEKQKKDVKLRNGWGHTTSGHQEPSQGL